MAEPFCERYALNMAFDPAACPAPAELSCLPRCRELLDANVDCYSPRPQDLTGADAWLAYPDGVACEATDGAAGGCRAGVCVPLAVCGNGVVEPGEECDDDVGVLHGECRLAAGARARGECCPAPACAAAPTTADGDCASRGGFCDGGACVEGPDAPIWLNGVTVTMPGGAVTVLALNTTLCPLEDGGCRLKLHDPVAGACYGGTYALADGTACADGALCYEGSCVAVPTCGDGVVEAGEERDDAAADAAAVGCHGCARAAAGRRRRRVRRRRRAGVGGLRARRRPVLRRRHLPLRQHGGLRRRRRLVLHRRRVRRAAQRAVAVVLLPARRRLAGRLDHRRHAVPAPRVQVSCLQPDRFGLLRQPQRPAPPRR